MSMALSIRIPEKWVKQLDHLADLTERSRTFLMQKALQIFLEDYADLQIALDRLRDKNDAVLSSREMRKTLGL